MFLDQVKKHLSNNASKGLLDIPEEWMEEALVAIRQAFEEIYSAREFRFPRASDLGHESRRLWFMRLRAEEINRLTEAGEHDKAKELSLYSQESVDEKGAVIFWQGKVLEQWFMIVARMAGVKLEDIQKSGTATIGGATITSSGVDFVVDGEIYDVKTCNDWSFKNKWKDPQALADNDTYGYIEQAAVYEMMHNKPFAGWIVINKNFGDMKYVAVDSIRDYIDMAKERIENSLVAAYQETIPAQCHELVDEQYLGEFTGNTKVHNKCASCPFVDRCYPDSKVAYRGKTPIRYIGDVVFNIPGVVIKDKS